MSRFKPLFVPGVLALALCFPTHAVRADAPSRSSASSHVLVGMMPNTGFEITCDDSLVYQDPVASDGLGILGFTVDRGDFPSAGLVCLRLPAPPTVLDCTISELDTSVLFCWHTDRPALSHVEYGTSSGYYSHSSEEQPELTVEHGAVLASLIPETTYYYHVVSTDAFGNRAVTDEFYFDTCPRRPDITGMTAADVTATSFRVVWTTTTPADSRVEYGQNESCSDGTVSLPNLVTDHGVSIEDLSPGATYYFRARSVDECGCEVVSEVSSVTPTAETVQVIGVSILEVTPTTAAIRWWTNVPATSQVTYGVTPTYGLFSAFEADLVTNHLMVLDGLSPETHYHFRTISVDAGDHQAFSADLMFTTEPADTPQSLSIYNVSVHVVDGPAATVRWITNMPSTSLVEYGPDTSYGSSIGDSEEVTQHSVILGQLELHTLYHFRVASSAGATMEAISVDMVFSTQGVADLVPPMAPEGLVATSTESAVNLSWEPTPDGDLAGYTLYRKREGHLLYSVVVTVPHGQTAYSDADVGPGTYYDYAVAARDAAGNESGLSQEVRVMAGAGMSGRIWVFPNPVVDRTAIRFALPQNQQGRSRSSSDDGYTLRIYDTSGRLVRTLDGTSSASEPRTVYWDARYDGGRPVPCGTYFCVLANQAGTLRTKLLVLR
ncbi:fibronectin type III domain-containing protein [bacterium]|nr:fibronectin type III domain-containing protein [bacterium]